MLVREIGDSPGDGWRTFQDLLACSTSSPHSPYFFNVFDSEVAPEKGGLLCLACLSSLALRIDSWFFPSQPKVGDEHNGWLWKGDAWHPEGKGSRTGADRGSGFGFWFYENMLMDG